MGFIETPYRKVNDGKVDMKKLTFLSAEEEDTSKDRTGKYRHWMKKEIS